MFKSFKRTNLKDGWMTENRPWKSGVMYTVHVSHSLAA